MSFYRLRIAEIKGDKVITSYTRWLESIQVRGAEKQEVHITFSPTFRAHLAGMEEATPEVCCRETGQYWTPKSLCPSPVQLGEKVILWSLPSAFSLEQLRKVLGAEHGARSGREHHPRGSA